MSFRQYELSALPGVPAPYRTTKDCRALIGKEVAYDIHGSSYFHRGTVTGAHRREIEVDGNWINLSQIEQMHVVAP